MASQSPQADEDLANKLLSSLPIRCTYVSQSTSHTYSYIHIPSSSLSSQLPTLLFIHGYPSHSADWIYQIDHFASLGYPILAPDLLGFGLSSVPSNIEAYTLRNTANDLAGLVSHVLDQHSNTDDASSRPSSKKIVSIGHDIGATILSRFVAYYPDLFAASIYLSVGPPSLGTPFVIEDIMKHMKAATGSEYVGYIPWIGDIRSPPNTMEQSTKESDEQTLAPAQKTLESNARSAMSVLFAADEAAVWAKYFRPLHAFQEFVSSSQTVQIAAYFTPSLQAAHLDVYSSSNSESGTRPAGYGGACRWYAMWMQQLFMNDEQGHSDVKIETPVLFIGSTGQDGEMQAGFLRNWCTDLKSVLVESGHWIHLERRERVNEEVASFLSGLGC